MKTQKLTGLIAAVYTPLGADGTVRTSAVRPMTDYLLSTGISGMYVCGSTGEGMSLSSDERMTVAEAYVNAADGRVPVIVQVGHNSLSEARQLAAHAQAVGADVISATCPSYFKVSDVKTLTDCIADVAAGAPDLPFYYYHIPSLTGSALDMPEFLSFAGSRIPNLAGLKYTDTKLFEFQECRETDGGRFDVVWGCDEMLLGALATGAEAAIGSTYNIAAPLYNDIITAFTSGRPEEARRLQLLSVRMIRVLCRYPFHSAMKEVLRMKGIDVGRCRLPQPPLSDQQVTSLKSELDAIDFFEWSQPQNTSP